MMFRNKISQEDIERAYNKGHSDASKQFCDRAAYVGMCAIDNYNLGYQAAIQDVSDCMVLDACRGVYILGKSDIARNPRLGNLGKQGTTR